MTSANKTKNKNSGGLSKFLPIVGWLPNYDRSWLKGDLIAGLSVWALMVPTSLGYATISGVPVQYGLYAAAVGLIAFALFTTSKQATLGPSSSTAAVLGAAVLAVASAGTDEAVAVAACDCVRGRSFVHHHVPVKNGLDLRIPVSQCADGLYLRCCYQCRSR